MADDFIAFTEIDEYGDYFATHAKPLVGLSSLIDVKYLITIVTDAQTAVATELAKQGIQKSDTRTTSKSVAALTEDLQGEIRRFHKHLGSLDPSVSVDMDAFFPGGKLGKLGPLKPADLVSKAKTIVNGFSAKANAGLPGAAAWSAKIAAARDALDDADSGRGVSTVQRIQSTTALVAARETFLTKYNGVAKRAILALLTELDRKDEYRLFFKDLRVNEDGTPTKKEEKPAAAEEDEAAKEKEKEPEAAEKKPEAAEKKPAAAEKKPAAPSPDPVPETLKP